MRVGIGFDVHPFTEERPLYLGGIKVESDFGLKGHSDADVLIHALIDALLGAMGKGDIGELFPDSDQKYKNIRSSKLLDTVVEIMFNNNYTLINADLILLAEKPKIKRYKNKIAKNVSELLKVDTTQINIKATTTEGLGFIGRVEGIGAQAIVLLENK